MIRPIQSALRKLTHATRPMAMKKAGMVGSYNSVVKHVGRSSGRGYQTPIVAVKHNGNFLIALPYAQRTDWMKNVLATGHATIVADGETYEVDQPQVIPMSEATAYFGLKEQKLHRRFGVKTCLRLHLLAA
jgi:deazaflavin-dependent oxidoreductase (nitroreductase family)